MHTDHHPARYRYPGLVCVAFCLLFFTACGPPRDEVLGQAAVFATPYIFLMGLLAHYLHYSYRSNLSSDIKIDWRPSIIFLVLSFSIICALAQSSFLEDGERYLKIAVIFGGVSYIALLLIVTAVFIQFAPGSAFTWSPLLVLIPFVLPAIPLLFSRSSGSMLADLLFIIWLLPTQPVPLAILILAVLVITFGQKRA